MPTPQRWFLLALFLAASVYIHYRVKTIPTPEWADKPMTMHEVTRSRLSGKPAPFFSLFDARSDSLVSLQNLRGRTVLLNFMTSWCGPCRQELPMLVRYAQSQSDVSVIGIDVMEPPETAMRFADEMSISFPLLPDESGEASTKYNIHAYPTTVIVDSDGIVRAVHVGATFDFAGLVRSALATPPDTNALQGGEEESE